MNLNAGDHRCNNKADFGIEWQSLALQQYNPI